MPPELTYAIRALTGLSPEASGQPMTLFAEYFGCSFGDDVAVELDVSYSENPLQALDVVAPIQHDSARSALVFVHGGGYVGADKRELVPFYRNIACRLPQQN